jgi:hypothetical protein
MKLKLVLTLLAPGLLVSCAYNAPFRPVSGPEKNQLSLDRLNVYPEDVRKNPAHYANSHVAWTGIIVRNETTNVDVGGKIVMDTVFEHHYFDWEQEDLASGVRLRISPRGEGLFRMRWRLSRNDPDASDEDAIKYAAPGNLAIVYGTPESVDDDGTIVLRYHYVRILCPAEFTTNVPDYGRVSEPFRLTDANAK